MEYGGRHGGPSSEAAMAEIAEETAYYLNERIPAVALIFAGVRLPVGTWVRVAGASALPVDVEELLARSFPALKGMVLQFVRLMTDAEVARFENSLPSVP